jgi:arylsulfatase
VTPLDDRGMFELFRASRRPGMPTSRHRFVYHPPVSHIVADACPAVFRGWRMIVDLDHPGGDGVLVSRGSLNSGFVLYIQNGRCAFDYNGFHDHSLVVAETALAPGRRRVEVVVERQPDASGVVSLTIDGVKAAGGTIPRLLLLVSSLGMDFGRSSAPVSGAYDPPFVYPGVICSVTFELPPVPPELMAAADRAGVRAAVSRQ